MLETNFLENYPFQDSFGVNQLVVNLKGINTFTKETTRNHHLMWKTSCRENEVKKVAINYFKTKPLFFLVVSFTLFFLWNFLKRKFSILAAKTRENIDTLQFIIFPVWFHRKKQVTTHRESEMFSSARREKWKFLNSRWDEKQNFGQ